MLLQQLSPLPGKFSSKFWLATSLVITLMSGCAKHSPEAHGQTASAPKQVAPSEPQPAVEVRANQQVLPRTLVIVRDEDGRPVKGAFVGSSVVHLADYSLLPLSGALGGPGDTGDDGTAVISHTMSDRRPASPCPIIAVERGTGNTAIAVRPTEQLENRVELTLRPTRLVRFTMDLGATAGEGPFIRWADEAGRAFVTLRSTPREGHDGEFVAQLRLPPGDYQAIVLTASAAEEAIVPFEVPPGKDDLDLGVISAKPSILAELTGKKAPEFALRWREGAEKRVADFRNNVVVLYFWATWCGPCLQRMPDMIDLRGKFEGEPVEWIAIHDASFRDIAELDAQVTDLEKWRWGGRRLSLHTALDTPLDDGIYRGATTARYGVRRWPTVIIIDGEGKVVGAVEKDQIEPTIRRLLQ